MPAFEGELLELRGDEALCVFRSARQALRASVELQRRLRTATDEESAFPIGVGMGLDAGEAVPTQGGYRGASLNLAARLCALAKPGEILATESVAHFAHRVDGLRLLEGRSATLKGMARPVRYVVVESEQPLPPVPASVAAGRRRLTRGRAVLLLGAVGIVIAVALIAGTQSGQGTSVALAANAVGSLTASGAVSSQVVLPGGGRPGGIAAGDGHVWATDAVNGSLLEIDPSSGAIVDTVANAGVVPAGVAVGGGGVWVADLGAAAVRWYNASAPGKSSEAIKVGEGPGPMAYGLGQAWVVNTIDGTLQRIGSHLKPSRPVLIGVAPTAVTVGAGSAWVTDSGSSSVVRVSADGQVTDRINVGNDPTAIAFGGGDVWVANTADGTLTRITPKHDDATRVVPLGGRPTGVTFARGTVWATITQPNRIARIDPATLAVTKTTLASPPQAITHVGDRLWVTSLASPASHRGGTLRVLVGSSQGGPPFVAPFVASSHALDPGAATTLLLRFTNDGLVALRPASGATGGQLVPDLAVAMPVVSDGGTAYTFRLRRGIRYSNGQPVRPSDFRFAIERQFLNAASKNPVTYGPVFFSDIRGATTCQQSPRRCKAALDAGIVPDDRAGTVTIHLQHPDGGFLYNLTTTFADMLPPNGTPAIDSGKPVPATGPYMVSHATPTSVTLVRNPRFRVWSAYAQPAGFPNVISFAYQPDPGRALTEVEQGRADVMLVQPPADRSAELRTRYTTLIHPYVQLETNFIAFNTQVPPFSNLLARRAVNFALDRRRIVTPSEFESQTGAPTCQMLPPTMFAYRPDCPYTLRPNPASGAWHGPDTRRALALVRASGTQGDHVDLRLCGCFLSRNTAKYVARVLTQLGYTVDFRWYSVKNKGTYFQDTDNSHLPLVVGEGWTADYPYPSDFFDPILTCESGGFPEPGIRFCDPHLDHLIQTAERTNGTAALTAWQAVDRETVDQAALAPLTNDRGLDVISHRVGNYQRNPQFGEILDQFWVR